MSLHRDIAIPVANQHRIAIICCISTTYCTNIINNYQDRLLTVVGLCYAMLLEPLLAAMLLLLFLVSNALTSIGQRCYCYCSWSANLLAPLLGNNEGCEYCTAIILMLYICHLRCHIACQVVIHYNINGVLQNKATVVIIRHFVICGVC